jgi:hydroxymethylbilane synthase
VPSSFSNPRDVVIGTRGSPLALAQARMSAAAILAATGWPEHFVQIEIIKTTGDLTQDRPLSEIGGKGLFTKEIDLAQLEGRIDLAVHSAKDLPTQLPDGLALAGCLERVDPRDALIAPRAITLAGLPMGARIGTVSLRRQALLKRLRPDLLVEPLRGNVESRLNKARSGEFDGVVLAMAGLIRLGLAEEVTEILDPTRFLPAIGQGAIAIVARKKDTFAQEIVDLIAHAQTLTRLLAERAFLRALDGSCRTPIAGHGVIAGDCIHFEGLVLAPDGSRDFAVAESAPLKAAEALGQRLGETIKARLPAGFLATGP